MTVIELRGARQHNLQGVDLDLPRESFTVFAGPSGSGKSSLAFDTFYAEGRRRYLDALAGELRGLPSRLVPPDFDRLDGLPPTIALDQRLPEPMPRDTVASLADLAPVLRVLWARGGVQHCPVTNDPIVVHTHEEVVNALDGLPEGTRLTIESPVRRSGAAGGLIAEITRAGFSRVRVRGEVSRVEDVRGLTDDEPVRVVVDRVRVEPGRRERIHDAVRTATKAGHGVIFAVTESGEHVYVDRPYSLRADRELPRLEVGLMHAGSPTGWCFACEGLGTTEAGLCPSCGGERLREDARAVRLHGRRLPDFQRRSAEQALAEAALWPQIPAVAPAVEELRRRLGLLVEVGLGHLPLDRPGRALSTGERQRLRLTRQIGARLSGVLYVLDEPASGLGPADAAGVARAIRGLVAQGNTAVVVEHHPAIIAAADRVVEMGPGPGLLGGHIVYDGPPAGLAAADTATGRWLSGRAPLPASAGRAGRALVRLSGLSRANLHDARFELPVGALVVLVGPSGAGKSTLLDLAVEAVNARIAGEDPAVGAVSGAEAIARVVQVDRGAMRRSPRSNPATYVGIWDLLRELLAATAEAQVRGLGAAWFSLNVTGGRCEACKGTGVRVVELQVVADVYMPCEVCGGRRFHGDVLEVRWKGRNAHELLELPAAEARVLLAGHPKLEVALRALCEVGLGYLPLGQPGHTLSGGEAQRLKLARELARAERGGVEGTLYVLDDPTVGLHPVDVAVLLGLLQRLVDQGATVWLATHDEAVAATADAVVRLG